MIGRHQSVVFAAVLIAACSEPSGVLNEPPAAAFAKGGGANSGMLLPTLGGPFSEARAVNDAGVVIGFSSDNTSALHAVRWTRTSTGSWSITSIAGPDSRAFSVNASGVAVGVRAGRAKLWLSEGEIDLGPGNPGGINSAETVVGYRTDPLVGEIAVVWRKPSPGWNTLSENVSQDLPAFSGGIGRSQAYAINDAGVISGATEVSTPTSGFYAVRWDPVGDDWGEPAPLAGVENFSSTSGRAINDNADIAGHVRACQQSCSAFGIFWPNASSGTTLEPFFGGGSGLVDGMNNAQRLVGFRDTRNGRRAFVWWPGRTSLQDLGGANGYSATWAYDINNLSPAQAVGYGQSMKGSRAIVWTIP